MSTERDRLVRERAYHLWEAGGRQPGRSHEHWEQAETEVGKAGPAKTKAAPGKKAGPEKAAALKTAKAPAAKAAAPKAAAKAPAAKAAVPKTAAKAPAETKAAKPRKAPPAKAK